ncbi:MAG: hypothetical protein KGL39_25880, partial [Patescibacteria group bacterium]|nr:hypothetical protein [Patescibacteria group bacterium]
VHRTVRRAATTRYLRLPMAGNKNLPVTGAFTTALRIALKGQKVNIAKNSLNKGKLGIRTGGGCPDGRR